MCTRVVNKNKEAYDVYIGRGGPWGNPYKIGAHGTREQVIEKHKQWLRKQFISGMITIDDLESLRGKKLGCFCSPLQCHGENIIALMKDVLEGDV